MIISTQAWLTELVQSVSLEAVKSWLSMMTLNGLACARLPLALLGGYWAKASPRAAMIPQRQMHRRMIQPDDIRRAVWGVRVWC